MNTIISFDYDILSLAFALARPTQPYMFALHTSNIWFSVSIWMNAWVHWNFESLSHNLCCNWQTKKKIYITNWIHFYDGFTYTSATAVPSVIFFFFFSVLVSLTKFIICFINSESLQWNRQKKKITWEMIKNDVYISVHFESRPNKCAQPNVITLFVLYLLPHLLSVQVKFYFRWIIYPEFNVLYSIHTQIEYKRKIGDPIKFTNSNAKCMWIDSLWNLNSLSR